MKPETFEELIRRARRAPTNLATEAPPFFAHRVVANWLGQMRARERSPWESFCALGAALSVLATVLALGLSVLFSLDPADEADADDAVEFFSLP